MKSNDNIIEKIKEARIISFQCPNVAFQMSKEIYEDSRKNNLVCEQANALFVMALACRSMTKLKDCYEYAYDSLKLFESLEDYVGISGALNLLGVVYFYYGKYESALEYFLKALNSSERHHDNDTLIRIYNNLGEVHRETGDLNEALAAYEKALSICLKHDFLVSKVTVLSNIGEIYFQKKDYENSYKFYKESYNIILKSGNVVVISEVETRIGKIYYVKNQFDIALDYYLRALKRLEDIDNKFFIIDVLVNLAELYRNNNEELFLEYLDKALKYGKEINAKDKICNIYKTKAKYFENKRDFEQALEYYRMFYLKEQEIEATNVSRRLEIIKMELKKMFTDEEMNKLKVLNKQLEFEIKAQRKLVNNMEKANANLNEKVFIDDLTGIYNRRWINNYLSSILNNEASSSTDVALLMIDIDHFKRYNDCMGHLKGDVCLKKVTNCMKKAVSNTNGLLGRYGGEEFVCIIQNAEYQIVMNIAQKMRETIEKENIKYGNDNLTYTVTISIGGVIGRHKDFNGIKSLYDLADKELYKVKNGGRNGVSLRKVYDALDS